MRNLARLAARIYNTPLLIEEEKGATILGVFQQYSEERVGGNLVIDVTEEKPPEQLYGVSAQRVEAGYYRTESGVSIIPILGSLVQRGSMMDSASGLTSYSKVASQLNAAMNDRETRAIVLEVDSPGGEAAGIFELAKTIREAGKTKPIFSAANEIAFSGGYILLAAADHAFMTEPGMVGSVGVVMYHMDRSKQLEKQGVRVTPIFAGKHKVQFSSHQALDPAALEWAQDSVDRTYDRFANSIAAFRDVSVESVKDTQAALLHSDQAQELNFVDGIATLSEVVSMAADKAMRKIHNIGTGAAVSNAHNVQEQIEMDPNKDNAPVPTATTAATVDTSAATAATMAAAAVTAERERVAGILGCAEAKGREKLAQHFATKTGMSVADAVAALGAASLEAAPNALNAAMSAMGNQASRVGAAGAAAMTDTAASGAPAPVVVDANQIFKNRAKQAEAHRNKHG